MAPPGTQNSDLNRVPLFWTARAPLDTILVQTISERAYEACEIEPPVRLESIPEDDRGNNFAGWTPLQIASRYVMPKLAHDPNDGFVCQSFIMVDDTTLTSGKLLLAAIDHASFKPGARIKIEATLRIEAAQASQLPVLFHDDIQGIVNYGGEPYDDNNAEQDIE